MLEKEIAFQRMVLMILRNKYFPNHFSVKDNTESLLVKDNRSKAVRIAIGISEILIALLYVSIFSNSIFIITLWALLCPYEAFVYENPLFFLPLKRNYILSRLCISSAILILIINAVWLVSGTYMFLISAFSDSNDFPIMISNIRSLMIAFAFCSAYPIIYASGILLTSFAKSTRLRIGLITAHTLLVGGSTAAVYFLTPNSGSGIFHDCVSSLENDPHIGLYIALMLALAFLMTFGGILLAELMDKAKGGRSNA